MCDVGGQRSGECEDLQAPDPQVGTLARDLEAHALTRPQQPETGPGQGLGAEGQFDTVVEEHRTCPGVGVEAVHGGLHGQSLRLATTSAV